MKIFLLAFKLSEDESAFGFITLASSALSTLPCTNKSLLCSEYMKNETCNRARKTQESSGNKCGWIM